jgi:hypothetical protein
VEFGLFRMTVDAVVVEELEHFFTTELGVLK